MKRYAFIDVQNTETTALKVLKFALDHQKLFTYLKDKWKCERIFFYPGIQHGQDTLLHDYRQNFANLLKRAVHLLSLLRLIT